jgi:hypothetical protein
VIGDPAPIGFVFVGDPVPAPIVGIDPVADRIRTPSARALVRHPDVAPARMLAPLTVGLKRLLKFLGHLRMSRCHRADYDRRRQ